MRQPFSEPGADPDSLAGRKLLLIAGDESRLTDANCFDCSGDRQFWRPKGADRKKIWQD